MHAPVPPLRRALAAAGAVAMLAAVALPASGATASSAPSTAPGAAASAPACVPDALDASARLPGTSLLVTPSPGSREAMPQTQLSFLGVAAADISALTVRGSVSGLHSGRFVAYSQGDGGSFLPNVAFQPGETVAVTGTLSSGGSAASFSYSFVVGDPDPIARLPEPGVPDGPPGTVLHFVSAPRIDPAALTVTHDSVAARRGGDIFIAPYPGPGATGPAIFDPRGQLVWFDPLPSGTFATNVRVQRYLGRTVLTWWQGTISRHGFGLGEGEIYSTSYGHIATVRAGNGLAEDLHELVLMPGGVALITAWKPLYCDLASVGGPAVGAVYDATFQEIDVRTGLVRYEWDSIDHVPLADSYMPAAAVSTAWPYDWFHLNSIAPEPDGSLLISARSTWAVYDLDQRTGTINWELGGRQPSFTMGPGTATAWQHDAQPLGDEEVTLFDNGGPPSTLKHSDGLVVRIDPASHTASLVATVAIPTPIFAQTQGDLERLPDGDWWIGWGDVNESSEVSASGKLLFEAHTPDGSESYRTFRFPWSGRPGTRPSVAARRGRDGALRVYASWNGATDVAAWRVEGGSSSSALHAERTVARTGFETVIDAPATPWVAVVALDSRGAALAASRPVAVAARGAA